MTSDGHMKDRETAVTDEQARPQTEAGGVAPRPGGAAGSRVRRRVVIGLALALVVLVVVPGLFSVNPAVIGGRASVKVEYETWQVSKHGEAGCQTCHAAPGAVGQVTYAARMLGQLYASLVGVPVSTEAFERPGNATCTQCHTDLITTSPKGDLIIPHRAHTDILQIECVTCHEYLVHEESPEGRHTPTMAACLACHDGEQAKDACVTCHTAKAAPSTHAEASWLIDHAAAAATTDCASCHGWIENWCADCHERRPPSHTEDWRERHGGAVAKRRTCESCHTAAFCSECHGIVPELNYDPNVVLVK